ncbi:hypothetical protein ACFOEQ_17035 [Chryseobacterium arachidis]|uniref:hypothetical protein n=1 Tax=Chryseobacterium arachidis TaxID=1416778 RepID=UPI0036189187
MGFGSNNYFNLSAAPRVGYRLTDDLEGGLLGSVSWQKSNSYSSTMFGVGPFLNYYIARTFYVSANYQHYFINYKDKFYDFKANADEDALYLGGGYMQRIGNNSYLQLGLMYNVLWKENSSIFFEWFSSEYWICGGALKIYTKKHRISSMLCFLFFYDEFKTFY